MHKPSHPIPGQFQPTFLLFSSHLHFPLLLPPLSGERENGVSLTAATLSMCLVSFHISLSPPLPTFGSFKRQKEKVGTESVVAGMKFVQKYQRSLSTIALRELLKWKVKILAIATPFLASGKDTGYEWKCEEEERGKRKKRRESGRRRRRSEFLTGERRRNFFPVQKGGPLSPFAT